ncbi:MAG: exodeoxyribonuclease VII large subunit [Rikenellaceae bacterium]
MAKSAPQHTTLSQLQRSIQEVVVERFAMPLWVSAEISDLKVNGSGHCYLELVEKGESDGVAKAQARGVIWRGGYGAIAARFETTTGERLSRGIKILAKVLVTYHELYGMSLQITDIDPTYTLGEVERQRQEAIAKLKANGSWDVNRSLPLPTLTQRVAIVSSAQAAGYQDFTREMVKSPYYVSMTLFEAIMQGATAEESIIAALIDIANRRDEFDAVVVIRGGGSLNDLRCFDSYRLALHFARFPLPVIAGIGHDKDVSVVDMVANTTLKTPTAVAGWFYERMLTLDSWLQSVALEIHRSTIERTQGEKIKLEGFSKEVAMRCEEQINREKRELIDRLLELPDLAYSAIAECRKELDHAAAIVDSYSLSRLLEIGFSIVRQQNRAIQSVSQIVEGDSLTIELSDGEIETEVKKIQIWRS